VAWVALCLQHWLDLLIEELALLVGNGLGSGETRLGGDEHEGEKC
jgi:hypothetical protein